MINIQFINTGTITTVRYCDLLSGNVRDDYMPHVSGVGCIGKASSYHPAYNLWEGIISRCYNKDCSNYARYGAKGVTVCDKWKCFEYFLEDLPLIDGYNNWLNNPGMYHLDKDLKQIGKPYNQKIYSLETCCFISSYDNSRLASFEYCNNNEESSSKFIGVQKLPNGKFRSSICIDGIRYDLGIFKTEEEAAFAHNAECIKNNRIVLNKLNMCKIINPNKL